MRWIDIEKEKPEEGQIVWAMLEGEVSPVLLSYEFIPEGYWAFSRVYDVPFWGLGKWRAESHYDEEYQVTYWMPLPEPLS